MGNRLSFLPMGICLLGLLPAGSAPAQGFAAMASPPRFELRMKPGQATREIVEITNADSAVGRYRVKTADWSLGADASVTFHDDLRAGSCRPWVAIERGQVQVPPAGRQRYRFEINVPPDAPAGECRFALMIEGEDPVKAQASGLSIPVTGRLGVIVYVAVGDARPQLEIVEPTTVDVNGQRVPALRVRNIGNAHGRLSGFLSGTDARGREFEFTPSSFPILPGETRTIALAPAAVREDGAGVAFPITVRGQVEWDNGRVDLNRRFD
ncbi:MAG: hypothetical protein WBA53_10890 [Burkholderiaceae bacterium]